MGSSPTLAHGGPGSSVGRARTKINTSRLVSFLIKISSIEDLRLAGRRASPSAEIMSRKEVAGNEGLRA